MSEVRLLQPFPDARVRHGLHERFVLEQLLDVSILEDLGHVVLGARHAQLFAADHAGEGVALRSCAERRVRRQLAERVALEERSHLRVVERDVRARDLLGLVAVRGADRALRVGLPVRVAQRYERDHSCDHHCSTQDPLLV